jgi:hypothetical protein
VAVAPRRRDGIYQGALAKPIMRPRPPAFWGAVVPERIEAYRKQLSRYESKSAASVERQLSRKLALLFDHYAIADKEDKAALAWALASAHVPGFKVQFPETKSKRGRKRKWSPDRLEQLYQAVQSIRQLHSFNDRQALTFMVNNRQHAETWGMPTGHKGSKQQWIETLEARLQDAKTLRKLHDQAERDFQAFIASVKFRK